MISLDHLAFWQSWSRILWCYNQSLASEAGPLGQSLCHPVTERVGGGGAGGIGPDIIRKVQHSRGLMEHQVAKVS